MNGWSGCHGDSRLSRTDGHFRPALAFLHFSTVSPASPLFFWAATVLPKSLKTLKEQQAPLHFLMVLVQIQAGSSPAPVTWIHYWERPMNGDLEVCGAVLSFGPSCVRKAGGGESRSAAGRLYLLVRLSGTGFPLFHPGLAAPLSPRGHGSAAALHTLSSGADYRR